MKSPVLFLVFNRPDSTRQVFERLRQARPPRLYVSADGPRQTRTGEAERCTEVRAIATAVDWPCEVKTLFRDENLGCKMGVSSGVSWFFDQEPEGIIVEDDVLPEPAFFRFCEELLEKFRHDERIAMINGSNFVSGHFAAKESYFYSRYPYIWGWASWRRSWQAYDVGMKAWPAWRDSGGLKSLSNGKPLVERYWRKILEATYAGKIDTWDYQWFFAVWRQSKLAVVPSRNQITNLGYGTDATHTVGEVPSFVLSSPAEQLSFPLIHPTTVAAAVRADRLMETNVFGITRMNEIKHVTRSQPIYGRLASLMKSFARRT